MKVSKAGINFTLREYKLFATISVMLLVMGAMGIIANVILDFPSWTVTTLVVMTYLGLFGSVLILIVELETMRKETRR